MASNLDDVSPGSDLDFAVQFAMFPAVLVEKTPEWSTDTVAALRLIDFVCQQEGGNARIEVSHYHGVSVWVNFGNDTGTKSSDAFARGADGWGTELAEAVAKAVLTAAQNRAKDAKMKRLQGYAADGIMTAAERFKDTDGISPV